MITGEGRHWRRGLAAAAAVALVACSGGRGTVDTTTAATTPDASATTIARTSDASTAPRTTPGTSTTGTTTGGTSTTTPAATRIVVTDPAPGSRVSSPFRVAGQNSTYENSVQIRVLAADGRRLVDTFTTGRGTLVDARGNPVLGPFEASIAFSPGTATTGVLQVFEGSPDDGSTQQLVTVPIAFEVGGPSGLPGASMTPRTTPDTPGGPGATALLVDVRAGRHDGFERVVFEFSGPLPGYSVRYVDRPINADPSDLPVSVGGEGVLMVRMAAAAGVDLTNPIAHATYLGPARLGVHWPAVEDVVQVGDYEAVLTWAIGVWTRPPFTVTTMNDPARVVVDIASAAHVPGT